MVIIYRRKCFIFEEPSFLVSFLKCTTSSLVKIVMAVPDSPALAVLPTRCTYYTNNNNNNKRKKEREFIRSLVAGWKEFVRMIGQTQER